VLRGGFLGEDGCGEREWHQERNEGRLRTAACVHSGDTNPIAPNASQSSFASKRDENASLDPDQSPGDEMRNVRTSKKSGRRTANATQRSRRSSNTTDEDDFHDEEDDHEDEDDDDDEAYTDQGEDSYSPNGAATMTQTHGKRRINRKRKREELARSEVESDGEVSVNTSSVSTASSITPAKSKSPMRRSPAPNTTSNIPMDSNNPADMQQILNKDPSVANLYKFWDLHLGIERKAAQMQLAQCQKKRRRFDCDEETLRNIQEWTDSVCSGWQVVASQELDYDLLKDMKQEVSEEASLTPQTQEKESDSDESEQEEGHDVITQNAAHAEQDEESQECDDEESVNASDISPQSSTTRHSQQSQKKASSKQPASPPLTRSKRRARGTTSSSGNLKASLRSSTRRKRVSRL